MAAYELRVDSAAIRVLLSKLDLNLTAPMIARFGEGIRRATLIVQARAVRNVTGQPVVFEGGAFVVRVRTGTLRGSIDQQYPYGSPFAGRVFVNGSHMTPESPEQGIRSRAVSEYAGAIEWGHDEIDLKQHMLGKTVPFFAARGADAKGPYAARGLKPVTPGVEGYGAVFTSPSHNAKLAAKGKAPMYFRKQGRRGRGTAGKSYFITFRKVGREGWIIPAMPPRPFMKAALQSTLQDTQRVVRQAAEEALRSR